MEILKSRRAPLRTAFTRAFTSLNKELESSEPKAEILEVLFDQLEDKFKRIREFDNDILNQLLADRVSQDIYQKEFEACEAYVDKFISCKSKVKKILSKSVAQVPQIVRTENHEVKQAMRLPELSLKEFDGNPREWLSFWNTFVKIHEDTSLDDHTKFVYLIQATVPKSKARDIVDSFPTTADNYSKAIEHLKNRFGREDILIQVYVRDLLQLVLSNNDSRGKKFDISSLYDSLETKLRSLESLGVTEDKYASILFPLVESCLPYEILKVWEREREKSNSGKDELKSILEFLKNEVLSEERIMLARTCFGFDKAKKHSKVDIRNDEFNVATANDLFVGNTFKDKSSTKKYDDICIFCDKLHSSEKCFKVGSLSYEDKKNIVLKKGACFVCLKRNHISRNCRAKVKCVICNRRHLTILCPNIKTNNAVLENKKVEIENSDHVLCSQSKSTNTLLQTIIVRVKNGDREKMVRAIIDSGSEKSYLTEDVIKYLRYDSCGESKLIHKLFGGVETKEKLHHLYKVNLSSVNNDYNCQMFCLNELVICSDVRRVPNGPWLTELDDFGIRVTDLENNSFGVEKDIKLLIGADVAGKLLTGDIKILKSGPVAVKTHLGWTLMGKIPANKSDNRDSLSVISLLLNDSSATNLWKLDVLGITDPIESKTKLEEHEQTMQYFKDSVSRDSEGRYEVALPWVLDSSCLPSNRTLAEKRLAGTCRKLRDKNKTEDYGKVFDSWVQEKIIERINDDKDSEVHYLPHRPVFKESSSTTKVRPVFDASARVKGHPSLNDCLDKGLNLIELIPSLLNRFRKHPIGVISDIEKAFLQIKIKGKDRDYLRFLWKNTEGETEIYRHNRVVFGVNCSPFLLAATLNHHLENSPEHLLNTANILKESFYVDNCVCSFDTVEEVNKFISESRTLLSLAKFNLRGWQSNFPVEIGHVESNDSVASVLGLNWDLKGDMISCKFDSHGEGQIIATKRALLSSAHKLFDPIGFTSPVTLLPKLILQECWKLKLKWDDDLPEHLAKQFLNWKKDVDLISCVQIPRWINLGQLEEKAVSLHVFCDASKYAYATCVFLRVRTGNYVTVSFIGSRTRVAPLKNISIPRLELLACCIGARLGNKIIADLGIPNLSTFYWSDSMTALSWIKRDIHWGTFVYNRVQEIRNLTQVHEWFHIAGKLNAADLPSRGCSPEQFLKLKWWEGPEWLKEPESTWPQSDASPDEIEINSEVRKTAVAALAKSTKPDTWYYRYFSSYNKIIHLIAWIFRFINNSRKKNVRREPNLTCYEVESSERVLISLIQKEAFDQSSEERIRSLRPFADEFGIIRIKTQVMYRQDTESFRYPVLLPSNHPVVHLLISWKHQELLHAGVSQLMTHLRERYWIIKARKTIRTVVERCVRCKRFSARKMETTPIALPLERVQDAAVFQVVGIDLAGPLYLRSKQKSWVVLYTCAVYRAVHLELITSLSTEAFLQSLRRFIARRGRPTTIYSDNGTNFVGAEKAFSELDWNEISTAATLRRIRWKFNPPTAAWWGGWWERLIQMLKRILRKVLGRASLTYEELNTLLCDCEQTVNSRPLTYVTEDIDSLTPLTPAMFLQEIRSSDVEDIDTIDIEKMNKRIQYRQQVRNHLRERFRIEYLGQLQQRTLHRAQVKKLAVGDIVLLENDSKKRTYWSLARVLELIPGKDGQIRIARIKTQCGELLRPIQRLFHLEIGQDPSTPETVLRTKCGRKVTVPDRLSYD